ncbi:tetratricopeptide repeat protein [Limoniibacter endophyticus]|uniref:Sel1 repeat family protein n=1 Tax=Limoniibacter endophyticus TaxID=1565040 RepID=A0A8J3DKH0_9HYPH|nr:tetratricopeptide repeat protein [Limoniibacter endophyticus]GHC76789.1 hypothetical protein GCM10010136_27810 [Limoniibacter endophyticus]
MTRNVFLSAIIGGLALQGALPAVAQDAASPSSIRAERVDPERFGGKRIDEAFGAYQRGFYKTAYELALPRAKNDDPAAQTLVAEILSRGLGVKRDAAAAADWYRKAAENAYPEAQFQYALVLLEGRYANRDEQQAMALMEAAAESGNRLAQFNYAQMLVSADEDGKNMEKARSYYKRAADAGLPDAQYAMSQLDANGIGIEKPDETAARGWLEKAARAGFDSARVELATMMLWGKGGARDEKGGFEMMRRAARSGNVAAQNRLAKLYIQAIGNEGDPIEAASWYMVARSNGLLDPEMEEYLQGLTDEQLATARGRVGQAATQPASASEAASAAKTTPVPEIAPPPQ